MNRQTIAFTALELKGLWLRATGNGEIPEEMARDPVLVAAAENAIDKVYRNLNGMPKKPTPPKTQGRGPAPDLRGLPFQRKPGAYE